MIKGSLEVFFNGTGISIGFELDDGKGSAKEGKGGPPGPGSGNQGGSSDKDQDRAHQDRKKRGADKFKRFGDIDRDMDYNQDDSIEDCLFKEDQDFTKEAEQGALVTPIVAFHPEVGHINMNMSRPRVMHFEKLLLVQGSGSQVKMVDSGGKMEIVDTGKNGANVNKECTLMGNDEQYIVHDADGPFLMNKNRWPNLSLHTEQDSQSQGGLGDLTQEDNLTIGGESQGILEFSFSSLGKEDILLAKGASMGNKLLPAKDLGGHKIPKPQIVEEDFLDQLSGQSKNTDMENECQGWQSPKSKKKKKNKNKVVVATRTRNRVPRDGISVV